jgi:uncharacterized membrane protein HdeD (DUF308 family)
MAPSVPVDGAGRSWSAAIGGRDVLPYRGLTLAFGLVETLFAFWLLARPGLTLVAMVLGIGLWTTIHGIVQIILSIEMKHLPKRVDGVVRGVKAVAA